MKNKRKGGITMEIKCSTNYCVHNDGNGHCTREEIFISDAETGDPICQDFEE